MLRHMPNSLRAELRRVTAKVGERVRRAVGRRALLEQPERDEGVEIVEQQVLVAAWRRVVEQRCAGHVDWLLPVLRGSTWGCVESRCRRTERKLPAPCGKSRSYAQPCAPPHGRYRQL